MDIFELADRAVLISERIVTQWGQVESALKKCMSAASELPFGLDQYVKFPDTIHEMANHVGTIGDMAPKFIPACSASQSFGDAANTWLAIAREMGTPLGENFSVIKMAKGNMGWEGQGAQAYAEYVDHFSDRAQGLREFLGEAVSAMQSADAAINNWITGFLVQLIPLLLEALSLLVVIWSFFVEYGAFLASLKTWADLVGITVALRLAPALISAAMPKHGWLALAAVVVALAALAAAGFGFEFFLRNMAEGVAEPLRTVGSNVRHSDVWPYAKGVPEAREW